MQSVLTTPAPREAEAPALTLALTRENETLRHQLDSAQDQLVAAAIEASDLHAWIEALHTDLVEMRAGRDGWRAEAEQLVGWSAQVA